MSQSMDAVARTGAAIVLACEGLLAVEAARAADLDVAVQRPTAAHDQPDHPVFSLDDGAVTLDATYTADFFYNLRGGINTSDAEQYRGLAVIELTFDTERLGLWEGGTFFVSGINNHGTDITERHVGDLQALNNADAPNDTRLYTVWYEQRVWRDRLSIKLGKIDANDDFAAPDYGGEFVHSSSGFSPTIRFPTWPDPGLGLIVSIEPAERLYVRGGLFDGQARGTRSGFDTAFSAPDDLISLLEVEVMTELDLFGQENLPGTYRIGGFYHSGLWDRFDEDAEPHRGNGGVYLVFDQQLYLEHPRDENDAQGLGAFVQFGWAPSAYNEITEHFGGGVQYVGMIPGRDEDVSGLAVHHVNLSDDIRALDDRHWETAVELFHRFQINDSFSVKPDLQYIANPGGNARDAIVAGIRIELSL